MKSYKTMTMKRFQTANEKCVTFILVNERTATITLYHTISEIPPDLCSPKDLL